jgi:uncharacterized protein YjbI with pentapeptide repeats
MMTENVRKLIGVAIMAVLVVLGVAVSSGDDTDFTRNKAFAKGGDETLALLGSIQEQVAENSSKLESLLDAESEPAYVRLLESQCSYTSSYEPAALTSIKIWDCSGAAFEWASFRDAELIRADFSGANLIFANFRDAELINVDFSGASLNSANFDGATVWAADFTDASLLYTSFAGAKLHNADFTDATIYKINLNGATIEGVRSAPSGRPPKICNSSNMPGICSNLGEG